MAWFMTRVEIHGAAHGDRVYEDLHVYMEAEGFRREIQSTNNLSWYQLPPAEYDYEGNATTEEVHAKAKRAAIRTGYAFAVLVTRYDHAVWVGLEPVPTPLAALLSNYAR